MNQMQRDMNQVFGRDLVDWPSLTSRDQNPTEGIFRVVEEDGKKKVRVHFDAHDIKPEDIEVKSSGNRLEIHAKTEEKSDYHHLYQEFSRTFTLPEGVKAEELTCNFEDGLLTLEAPYTPPAIEGQETKKIDIKREEREPVRKQIPIKQQDQNQQQNA